MNIVISTEEGRIELAIPLDGVDIVKLAAYNPDVTFTINPYKVKTEPNAQAAPKNVFLELQHRDIPTQDRVQAIKAWRNMTFMGLTDSKHATWDISIGGRVEVRQEVAAALVYEMSKFGLRYTIV